MNMISLSNPVFHVY
jgi:hypothetical protein